MFKLFAAIFTLAIGLALPAQAQNFESMQASGQIAASAQAATSAPAPTGACGDDPRLESELLTLLQSNAPINPPLTVSPETFLNMDSEVLQVLGGQMIICPNIPVLKGGKPMKKVPTDFESIWDNVRKAAIAGDDARMKQILTGFTAKPKTAQEIVNMLTPIALDEKTQASLYKAIGGANPKEAADAELIDFYKALGGKVADNVQVVFLYGKYMPENANETDVEQEKNIIYIEHQSNNGSFGPNKRTEKHMRKLETTGIPTRFINNR